MDRRRYRDHLEALRHARPHAPTGASYTFPRARPTDGDEALTAQAFAAFSANDYRRRIRLHPDVAWEDACHAYALAAATYADHGGQLDLETEGALEAQWEAVRGESDLDWSIARTLLRETWRWMDDHAGRRDTLH